ncbi:filamentous hemagglutinin N-terminal domain-containing protein [Nostoc sphaeroides]|uniref:two-partner secretion domain-containing protein n=1 Tax=Nostoc sphaeroides TaxID=446679 RepID=UPI001269DE87|nr:S-layer family protein [Nostoc sphaeroides]
MSNEKPNSWRGSANGFGGSQDARDARCAASSPFGRRLANAALTTGVAITFSVSPTLGEATRREKTATPLLRFLSALTIGFLTSGIVLPAILLWSSCANAQVTSDGTINTIVNQNGNNFTILNGIGKGNNLFHSFSNLSVPTGGSASFDLTNTPNITTIFSRVTGGNVSNIDGLIRTLNSSNPVSLFLMNPAGIVFGKNARLDIGGSFVGTTANSIKFSDGLEFSANLAATPLLSMSVPIGLQMGQTPGMITVQNTGHRLIEGNAPLQMGTTPNGLGVAPGKTLALVGEDIILEGGILTVPSGHLELGSARAGTVNLSTASPHWNFDYGTLQQYGDIQFSRQALADASGATAGSIHLQGRNINVNEGSVALLTNQGNQVSGDITVNASESLSMQGVGTYGFAQSLLVTNAIAGAGGNVLITAPQVLLEDGGKITTRTYGSGMAGNISVAANSIQLTGFSSVQPATTRSEITSQTLGVGQGGNVQVTTQQLRLQEGGSITGGSQGTGATGNVRVNASEFIELGGETPISFSATFIGAVSVNRGNVGNVTVNTPRLSVRNGGGVGATTLGQGNAGTLLVNAWEQISVSGVSAASGKPSQIGASATVLPLVFQKAFGLLALPTGDSGDLIINTPRLEITDGGVVRVNNQGVGNAGNLYINADTIALDRSGTISASTNSGTGGAINLQSNTLILRHGSNIIATAGGTGNGGNITINSPIILGLENSDIVANAFQGKGGNINITTQGIFGLKYRNQLTPENDITASSQFGVNGTVDINNFGVDPSSGLVELPVNLVDSSKLITTGCSNNTGSSFVATGRGGVPQNPTQEIGSDRTWSDIRDLSTYRKTGEVKAQITPSPEVLVQATSWRRNAQGKIELVADKSPTYLQQPLTCADVTKIF